MVIIGCNCGGRNRNRQVQVMDAETAQAVVDQQAVVNALTAPTIVDPDELVHQPH